MRSYPHTVPKAVHVCLFAPSMPSHLVFPMSVPHMTCSRLGHLPTPCQPPPPLLLTSSVHPLPTPCHPALPAPSPFWATFPHPASPLLLLLTRGDGLASGLIQVLLSNDDAGAAGVLAATPCAPAHLDVLATGHPPGDGGGGRRGDTPQRTQVKPTARKVVTYIGLMHTALRRGPAGGLHPKDGNHPPLSSVIFTKPIHLLLLGRPLAIS
jgi:hypothetical protein